MIDFVAEKTTARRYYTLLLLGLLLGAGSLSGRTAPWGVAKSGSVTENWLNPMTLEVCLRGVGLLVSLFTSGTPVTIGKVSPNAAPNPNLVICVDQRWADIITTSPEARKCYQAGTASFALFVIGMSFIVILIITSECRLGEKCGKNDEPFQIVLMILSALCIITPLPVFHNGCTFGVNYDLTDATVSGAYGFAVACISVIFLLLFMIMHFAVLRKGQFAPEQSLRFESSNQVADLTTSGTSRPSTMTSSSGASAKGGSFYDSSAGGGGFETNEPRESQGGGGGGLPPPQNEVNPFDQMASGMGGGGAYS